MSFAAGGMRCCRGGYGRIRGLSSVLLGEGALFNRPVGGMSPDANPKTLVDALGWPSGHRQRRGSGGFTAARHRSDEEAAVEQWERVVRYGSGWINDDKSLSRVLLATASRPSSGSTPGLLPQRATSVLLGLYRHVMAPRQREHFFNVAADVLGPQQNEVQVAVASWEKLVGGTACGKRSSDAVFRGLKVMQDACQPGYAQTFRRLAQQQDGIHFLVQFRADLQAVISKQPGSSAALRAMSETLRGLLADWFSVGMIRMEQISWKHSSAAMLEKVVAGEAVHSIRGWRDLRRRLSPSKRLFAFFHPSMPDEPLVLLHTALCHGIASKMGSLLMPSEAHDQHEHAPSRTSDGAPYTTAVFYSISSTQPGLKGVELGNFLIKQAARKLQVEIPTITTLVTLSPIPGFRPWLEEQIHRITDLSAAEAGHSHPMKRDALLTPPEVDECLQGVAWAGKELPKDGMVDRHGAALKALEEALRAMDGKGQKTAGHVRSILMRLCAVYLAQERRRTYALDPVAHFHLKNGSWLWQINWEADMSAAGMARSYGMMVNYRYILEDVDKNSRDYLQHGVIPISDAVQALLV